jgi:hypothetical protein
MVMGVRTFCPVTALIVLNQLVLFVNYNWYAKVFINVGHIVTNVILPNYKAGIPAITL